MTAADSAVPRPLVFEGKGIENPAFFRCRSEEVLLDWAMKGHVHAGGPPLVGQQWWRGCSWVVKLAAQRNRVVRTHDLH